MFRTTLVNFFMSRALVSSKSHLAFLSSIIGRCSTFWSTLLYCVSVWRHANETKQYTVKLWIDPHGRFGHSNTFTFCMSVWARSAAPCNLSTGRGFLRSIMLRRCVPSEWVRCSSNHDDNRDNLVISTTTGINILNEIRADNPYSAPNIYPHHSEIVRGKWHNLDTLSVTMRRCDIDQRRRFRTCWIRYQRRYQFDATMIWWHESYWKVPKHSYSLDRQQISD